MILQLEGRAPASAGLRASENGPGRIAWTVLYCTVALRRG